MSQGAGKVLWALLGVAVGGIVSTTWLASSSKRSTDSPPPSESASTTAQDYGSISPPAARPVRLSTTTPPLMSGDVPSSRAELLRNAEQVASKHERQWEFDPATTVDSAEMQRQLESVATSPRLLSEVRNQPIRLEAACRSTMCRIESRFGRGADADGWVSRVLVDMGPAFGSSTTVALPQENGELKVVTYAYRSGHAPSGS